MIHRATTHFVKIYPNKAHWMDREDRPVAIPWMASHTRNATPSKLVWKQDNVTHEQFYWLGVDEKDRQARSLLRAEANGQTISLSGEGVSEVIVRLDDRLVDLGQTGHDCVRGPRVVSRRRSTHDRDARTDACRSRRSELVFFPPKSPCHFPDRSRNRWSSRKIFPHYRAVRCESAPVIDGKLDEGVWETAVKTGAFVDLISGKKTLHDTQAAITWDDDNLYIGF